MVSKLMSRRSMRRAGRVAGQLARYLSRVLLSSVVASALVLTAMHHLVWRYTPVDFSPIRQATYKLEGPFGSCSGVMVAPMRMLTAAHCKEAGDLKVGNKLTRILKETGDSMLLEVAMECPCVPVEASIVTGDDVYVVGYPLGAHQILKKGTFQGFLNSPRLEEYSGFLIFEIGVEGGFSGGGVFQFRPGVGWTLVTTVSAGSQTFMLAPRVLASE